MTIFCCSDPHFNHANIIRYCHRPFANVDEMNLTLLTNWNSVVKPEDTVIVNGDFQMGRGEGDFFHRLNGDKLLVLGNHDLKPTLSLPWKWRGHIFETNIIDNVKIIFCHYPMERWENSYRGSLHCFGHVHDADGGLQKLDNRWNICPERIGYTPIPLEEVLTWRKK